MWHSIQQMPSPVLRRVLARWDDFLASEGMPAEPVYWGHQLALHRDDRDRNGDAGGGALLVEAERADSLADHPRAAWWRALAHDIAVLPPSFPRRELLARWADTGNLEGSARELGVTRRQALTAVAFFSRWRAIYSDRVYRTRLPDGTEKEHRW